MKKTTATTALAATIGLSAWTMTAALAVAPTEAPVDPAPVTAPAEEVEVDISAPLEDGITEEEAAEMPPVDPWEGAMPPFPAGYVYPNCDMAYDSGAAYAFPVDLPFSGPHLDIDGDGMACETNGDDDAAFTGVVEEAPLDVDTPAPTPTAQAPAPAAEAPASAAPAAEGSQVEEVPVGGADTGASGSQARTGLLAGGAAVAALAGAGLLVRRARQH